MKGLVARGTLLLALAAAFGATPTGTAEVGSLACPEAYCPSPDCDTAGYQPYRRTPNCPLLVVGSRAGDPTQGDSLYRVAGSFGVLGWVARKELGPIRPSGLKRSLKGATAEPLSNPYSNSGFGKPAVDHPFQQVGLLLDTGNGVDTLPFSSAVLPKPTAGSSPCVTALRRTTGKGFQSPPLQDIRDCSTYLPGYWVVTDDSRKPPFFKKQAVKSAKVHSLYLGEGKPSAAPLYAALDGGLHLFSGKFGTSFGVRFLSASADTSMPREEDILHIAKVEAADLNGDGRPEWVLEIRRWHTDGHYRQLAVLSMGSRLHALFLGLDGFTGDTEGGNSAGAWWNSSGPSRRLYLASAVEDTAKAGMTLTSVLVEKDGRIRVAKDPSYAVAFPGGPGMKSEVERAIHRMREKKKSGSSMTLQALPWNAKGGLLWRPGLVVPSGTTRARFAGLSDSVVVEKIRRAD